ncbi:hypothetical protein P7K49_035605 [Saguinus oedipus]|uniref:Uncharacterized protein n=1 Tax=Saguinus oedipus TaxID=9490 RepID=A0ABQ9TN30_SAGOE|nr:hypothetical protein P7K49_035605 [Saguinus oedipus]
MEDLQSEQQRMLRCHQCQKKEPQAHIQSMKNFVLRSDKKKRKQFLLDMAEMEQKHQQELGNLQEDSNLDSVTEDLAKTDLENQPPQPPRLFEEHKMCEEEKLCVFLGARNLEMKISQSTAMHDQLLSSVSAESLHGLHTNYMQRHTDGLQPNFSDPRTLDA